MSLSLRTNCGLSLTLQSGMTLMELMTLTALLALLALVVMQCSGGTCGNAILWWHWWLAQASEKLRLSVELPQVTSPSSTDNVMSGRGQKWPLSHSPTPQAPTQLPPFLPLCCHSNILHFHSNPRHQQPKHPLSKSPQPIFEAGFLDPHCQRSVLHRPRLPTLPSRRYISAHHTS